MNLHKKLINNSLPFLLSFFLAACSSTSSEAEEMGQKWCGCNKTMGGLYQEMNATEDKKIITALSAKLLSEQANVLQCMGGEEKLKGLNDKFLGTDFQKYYDQTRMKNCAALVQLLSKKGQ